MSGINTDKSLQLLGGKFIEEYCLLTLSSKNITLDLLDFIKNGFADLWAPPNAIFID